MTNVRFYQEGKHYEVEITGHAEFDYTGKDIVCAAISALAFTLANAIMNTECDNDVHMQSGDVQIIVDCTDETEERVNVLMQTFLDGFLMLANKHPDNVSVI